MDGGSINDHCHHLGDQCLQHDRRTRWSRCWNVFIDVRDHNSLLQHGRLLETPVSVGRDVCANRSVFLV